MFFRKRCRGAKRSTHNEPDTKQENNKPKIAPARIVLQISLTTGERFPLVYTIKGMRGWGTLPEDIVKGGDFRPIEGEPMYEEWKEEMKKKLLSRGYTLDDFK